MNAWPRVQIVEPIALMSAMFGGNAAGDTCGSDHSMTSSNIEPLAREMAERICRRSGMREADIPLWVDLHWSCAAAMLEAGVMDESGDWIEGTDVRRGLEAYRERFSTPR